MWRNHRWPQKHQKRIILSSNEDSNNYSWANWSWWSHGQNRWCRKQKSNNKPAPSWLQCNRSPSLPQSDDFQQPSSILSSAQVNTKGLATRFFQIRAELTKVQLKTASKEKKSKSVFTRLSDCQARRFCLLAATSWQDYNPKISESTRKLLADRNAEPAWNIVDSWVKDWKGKISKSSFIQFLAKGCISFQQLGDSLLSYIPHPGWLWNQNKTEHATSDLP